MGLFSKKKEEKKCCCGGSCNAESMKAAEVCKAGGASVKILGSGCAKCNQLEANTLKALKQLGLDTTIDHITDFTQIAAYGGPAPFPPRNRRLHLCSVHRFF